MEPSVAKARTGWRAWIEVSGWLVLAVWIVGPLMAFEGREGSPLTWTVAVVLMMVPLAARVLTFWRGYRPPGPYQSAAQAGIGIALFVISWWLPWVVSMRYFGEPRPSPGWIGYHLLGHPSMVFSLVGLTVLAVFTRLTDAARDFLWICALVMGGIGFLVYLASPGLVVWSNVDTDAWLGPGIVVAAMAYVAVVSAAVRWRQS